MASACTSNVCRYVSPRLVLRRLSPNAAASSLNVRSPLEAPRAAKRTGLNYNEETVTEGLLLDLQVNFPGDVLIVPFTKRREARIGADWAC